jgi:hypothetical protein
VLVNVDVAVFVVVVDGDSGFVGNAERVLVVVFVDVLLVVAVRVSNTLIVSSFLSKCVCV